MSQTRTQRVNIPAILTMLFPDCADVWTTTLIDYHSGDTTHWKGVFSGDVLSSLADLCSGCQGHMPSRPLGDDEHFEFLQDRYFQPCCRRCADRHRNAGKQVQLSLWDSSETDAILIRGWQQSMLGMADGEIQKGSNWWRRFDQVVKSLSSRFRVICEFCRSAIWYGERCYHLHEAFVISCGCVQQKGEPAYHVSELVQHCVRDREMIIWPERKAITNEQFIFWSQGASRAARAEHRSRKRGREEG